MSHGFYDYMGITRGYYPFLGVGNTHAYVKLPVGNTHGPKKDPTHG